MRRMFMLCLMLAFVAVLPTAIAQKVDAYHYFSTRLERIDDQLHLTGDQAAKLKPMIEHETSLMSEIYGNPVLTQKQKLKKYWAIINGTNERIKPMLNPDQLVAFDEVKRAQKQKYDELMQQARKKG